MFQIVVPVPRIMDIFVINLDRREDRWREISNHLRSLGLDATRVSAVDGRTIHQEDRTVVPPAVDASWQSHQRALQLIAQSPSRRNALVLEDDAVLFGDVVWPDFLREVDTYMADEAIDVLQLGLLEPIYNYRFEGVVRSVIARGLDLLFRPPSANRGPWHSASTPPAPLVTIPDNFAPGAHCYVISSSAARLLAGVNIPTCFAADHLFTAIAQEQSWYGRLKIARAKRSFATQRSRAKGRTLDSDIEREYSGANAT